MPRIRKTKDFNPNNCPVTHCLNKIGGKWKPLIMYAISKNVNRFSTMQKALPVISKQMLVNQLRELEEDGIISRKEYEETPPRTEYTMTEYGNSLMPVLYAIQDWGIHDMKRIKTDS